jgi:hypothetical protein
LVTWTAAELARARALRGDAAGAREALTDPAARLAEGEPGSETALQISEMTLALVERDREGARRHGEAAIEAEKGPRGVPNALAAQIWLVGAVFGAEAAGGPSAVQEAGERLRRNGWLSALREAELAAALG